MNKIGVMQGRLLPKYQNRYQAHPIGYWQKEFEIAKELKLDFIEFIFDYNDAEQNPLLIRSGIKEITSLSKLNDVEVRTICADYFMEAPLHSYNQKIATKSQQILQNLVRNSKRIGVTDIIIPCVDQASIIDKKASDRFVRGLTPLLKTAEELNINFALETDLSPQSFSNLLDRFQSENISVNYDIGNSASLGYNPSEEFDAYGHKITDIHIKDRKFKGGSVILGQGDADFNLIFNELRKINYQGIYIMQAFRDDEGIQIFKKQLNWISSFLV
jgi:L-ribulose-5-phosphate 3-epimerase